MRYVPIDHDERVNRQRRHPLREFAQLIGRLIFAVVALYIGLGLLVSIVAHSLTIAQEQWIWRQNEAFFGAQALPPTSGNGAMRVYLQMLLDRIPREPIGAAAAYDFEIRVIEDEQPNAFAVPGGEIWVTSGLMSYAQSENEITGILGHEMGHFIGRDQLESYGRWLIVSAVSLALFGESSGISQWIAGTMDLVDLQYSQREELAADVWGLRAVVGVYGHAGGITDFDQRILEDYGESALESVLSTHPPSSERIQQIEEIIAAEGIAIEATLSLSESYQAFLDSPEGQLALTHQKPYAPKLPKRDN